MLTAAIIVVVLYGIDRIWRLLWTTTPTPHYYETDGGDERTLVFVLTGAFNDVLVQSSRQIALLQKAGDVCAIRYPKRRFSTGAVLRVMYEYLLLHRKQYDTVILDGQSLGGGLCLLFYKYVQERGLFQDIVFKAMPSDMPQGWRHFLGLSHPALRWLVTHVRSGPILNLLLSRLVMHLVFKTLEVSSQNGVDRNQLTLHMEAMWRLPLSALIEQISAIVEFPEFGTISGMDAVYLMCEKDEVIDALEALKGVKKIFGRQLLGVRSVRGGHTQWVEYHTWWTNERIEALRLLGYDVG